MKRYNDYLSQRIISERRHLFLYGYNNDYRHLFLQSIEHNNPLMINSNKPVAFYLNCFGLPNIEINNNNDYLLQSICNEYLYFTIATKLLEKAIEVVPTQIIDNLFSEIINKYESIYTTNDLYLNLKRSREFYYNNYVNYVNGIASNIPINELLIPFIELNSFIKKYKKVMNIDSYFGIILDHQQPINTSSIKAVNNLVASRINKDLSLYIATSPGKWPTYWDSNHHFVEAIHDYGIIELDDSYQKYIKKNNKYK